MSPDRAAPRTLTPNPLVPGALEPGLPTAHFGQVIRATLPPETLWRIVLAGLRDSATAPVWPKALATHRVLSGELGVGAVVEVCYHAAGVTRTVHYDVIGFDERAKILRYWTEVDHPLWGGATVEVLPQRDGSCLRWEGAYQARNVSGLAALAWFKLYFQRRFFRALSIGLRERKPARPTLIPWRA
jgi:hypothetical protein